MSPQRSPGPCKAGANLGRRRRCMRIRSQRCPPRERDGVLDSRPSAASDGARSCQRCKESMAIGVPSRRNHAEGGKLSAQVLGIAADILILRTHKRRDANHQTGRMPVLQSIRSARRVCDWFATVLGPRSHEAHANHIHVGILKHGSSNHCRICS